MDTKYNAIKLLDFLDSVAKMYLSYALRILIIDIKVPPFGFL